MTSLAVSRRSDGVRITVKVRGINRSARLSQIFLIDLDAPGFDAVQMQVATHSLSDPPSRDDLEHNIVMEGAVAPEGYVECDDLAVSIHDGADTWWVDVPRHCLPATPVKLSVYAQTTPPLGGDDTVDQWSHDTLSVPGQHSLGGTVHPDQAG